MKRGAMQGMVVLRNGEYVVKYGYETAYALADQDLGEYVVNGPVMFVVNSDKQAVVL